MNSLSRVLKKDILKSFCSFKNFKRSYSSEGMSTINRLTLKILKKPFDSH